MYATVDGFLARFNRTGELTQLTGDPDAPLPNAARLAQALAEASGEMDESLRARYLLPLTGIGSTTSERLAQLCCDIARYRLWSEAASEEVVRRYTDATAVLTRIASGELAIEAAVQVATTGSGAPRASGPAATFGPATLGDY